MVHKCELRRKTKPQKEYFGYVYTPRYSTFQNYVMKQDVDIVSYQYINHLK